MAWPKTTDDRDLAGCTTKSRGRIFFLNAYWSDCLIKQRLGSLIVGSPARYLRCCCKNLERKVSFIDFKHTSNHDNNISPWFSSDLSGITISLCSSETLDPG